MIDMIFKFTFWTADVIRLYSSVIWRKLLVSNTKHIFDLFMST